MHSKRTAYQIILTNAIFHLQVVYECWYSTGGRIRAQLVAMETCHIILLESKPGLFFFAKRNKSSASEHGCKRRVGHIYGSVMVAER